jgi:hypothetical protein
MASTQDFIEISDIHDDLVILKDGSIAMVMQSGAVNFDLLSEREQLAIIDSFAGFLNSLSFAVQIVVRSKRLDISSYLETLDKAYQHQTNPLLAKMMQNYRQFISQTIKENDVLDKQFYIVVQANSIELGILKNSQQIMQKALTILIPRRDHIIKQFNRIGIKISQLDNENLIKLFYDIYNESFAGEMTLPTTNQIQQDSPQTPQLQPQALAAPLPTPQPLPQNIPPQPRPTAPFMAQTATSSVATPLLASNTPLYRSRPSNSSPYVVEELPDDYGVV